MKNNDLLTSIIRTGVPLIVGVVVTTLAKIGLDIDASLLTPLFTAIVSGAYYAVVRAIEEKKPKAGKLLGRARPPKY
jgi:hypothetical protein